MDDERICVYTCITGNYDDLQEVKREEGIDYICFTNNGKLKSKTWRVIQISDEQGIGDMLLSRQIKIVGHPLIRQKYDISIWVDGAVQIKGEIRKFLDDYCHMDHYNMACFRHRLRDCVYDEAVACIIHRKADKENVLEYIDFLKDQDYPTHFGLAECTILIRRHNDVKVTQTMELWFKLLCRYVKRDQLTFPYSLWMTGLQVFWLELNVFDNPWFFWHAHRQLNETNSARIFFGEYKNVYTDKYVDQVMKRGEEYRIQVRVPIDCDSIAINIGKHFGKFLENFKINLSEAEVSFFPGISLEDKIVFDYDDLVVYVKGKLNENLDVFVSFDISDFTEGHIQELAEGLVNRYYYDKISRDNMITYLNNRCDGLCEKVSEYECLQKNPIFKRMNLLCEKQDLKTKIIRNLVLNFIKE